MTSALRPMKSLVAGVATLVRRHSWWIVPSVALAVVLGQVVGNPVVWIVYVVFNNVGVWVAVDNHRFSPRGPRAWMAWCAIVLLPAGPIGLFSSGGGMTPIEQVASGSLDEATRRETARALSKGVAGPYSGTF